MNQTPEAARPERAAPGRRLVAAGFIRRTPGRTTTVRVTAAGVTGTITRQAVATTPTCHGKPMRHDGQQYVCTRCGAWTDLGTIGKGAAR